VEVKLEEEKKIKCKDRSIEMMQFNEYFKNLKEDNGTDTGKMSCGHEDSHPQVKEKDLEQIHPSQPSKGISPTNPSIPNFCPLQLQRN
jgi:hypothetical protein